MAIDKQQLEQIFNNDYPGSEVFINEVVKPIFGDDITEVNQDLAQKAEYSEKVKRAGLKHIMYIGDLTEQNYSASNIALLDVTIDDRINIERSRVNIQRLIRSIIDDQQHLIIIFHYEDVADRQWRFSYAYKGRTQKDSTSAKRYTYVFGRGYRGRTAAERFAILAESRRTDDDFEKAFSVEALSDKFFDEYKKQYLKFVEYISGKRFEKKNGKWQEVVYHEPQPFYTTSFNGDDKLVRDYVKKLFGRIVFMYFLQRKGWLANNPRYMSELFANAGEQQETFLDDVLEPLFFGVLNTQLEERDERARKLPGWDKIPYLNGGLFQNDEQDDMECKFPGGYFKDLFEFLDSYNFTIDENDPEDAEVGIDPEMLGRIFENLLEDNKDKGAYYTPKEIVEYMCRESVITYLQDKKYREGANELIRNFVETLNSDKLSEAQRVYLKEKLKKIRICDPAIGSGAFPMGMVNILSKLYIALDLVSDIKNMKRHIMERCIYGVDIEKGAVDIARLRFWLAMVVEDNTDDISKVSPLPNLHYKIMQGNSLVERYVGIDLSTLLGKNKGEFEYDYTDPQFQQTLEAKLSTFYSCSKHIERNELAEDIDELISTRLKQLNPAFETSKLCPSGNDKFFLWHTWFSDVFKDGGFDIVIGNPPYGAKLTDADKKLLKEIYYTTKSIKDVQKGSMDTYTMFIELSYKLLKKGGAFAMIVPISLTSSDSLSGIHRILNCKIPDFGVIRL